MPAVGRRYSGRAEAGRDRQLKITPQAQTAGQSIDAPYRDHIGQARRSQGQPVTKRIRVAARRSAGTPGVGLVDACQENRRHGRLIGIVMSIDGELVAGPGFEQAGIILSVWQSSSPSVRWNADEDGVI